MKLETTALRGIFLMVLALGTIGCGDLFGPEDPDCAPVGVPGAVILTVEHAETAEPVGDALAVGRITGPILNPQVGFVDSARSRLWAVWRGDAVAVLGGQRWGTYDLTVEKEGFARWVRRNVKVTHGECQLNPANVTARLEPK